MLKGRLRGARNEAIWSGSRCIARGTQKVCEAGAIMTMKVDFNFRDAEDNFDRAGTMNITSRQSILSGVPIGLLLDEAIDIPHAVANGAAYPDKYGGPPRGCAF